MITIVFLNQKGGVGKTSTTHHLGGALAENHRVLLVDNDPQASLTQGFFGRQSLGRTIVECYSRSEIPIVATPCSMDLVPGSKALTSYNTPPPHDYEQRHCLQGLFEGYDFVLIDCPPNLHLCSWAADYLIVPLQPEDYGAQGIFDVREAVAAVQASDHDVPLEKVVAQAIRGDAPGVLLRGFQDDDPELDRVPGSRRPPDYDYEIQAARSSGEGDAIAGGGNL